MKKVKLICGLDEAGRGALAGPIVISAVVFPVDFYFRDLTAEVKIRDSKELSFSQRSALYKYIEIHSIQTNYEIISIKDINEKGINWANIIGFYRHITSIEADAYIVDGRWKLPDLGKKTQLTTCIIHADQFIPAVLAAGVVAKIKRDAIMQDLHNEFPMYGWNTNTGHFTKQHIEAIKEYGICKYHRTLFVSTALKNQSIKTIK